MPRLLPILLALLVAAPAAAQSVTASVDRMTAEVGELVAFTIEVQGPGAASASVRPPVGGGLTLTRVVPTFRSLVTVNGEARLTLRWLYEAERPGPARLGPARVDVRGRTLTTAPIPVTVVASSAPRGAPSGPPSPPPVPDDAAGELFVRAVPRPARPYVGQQVVVDYVLYFEPHLEPQSAQFVGAWQAEGLWREELDVPRGARAPQPVTVGGRRYYAVTVRRVALFPTRTGTVRLGALTFDVELRRRARGGDPFDFFRPFTSRFDREEATAPAVALTARPLPPGAPPEFSGAVGRFALEAALDRPAADAGDPLRLTVTVEGTGNLATLPPLALDAPPSFERYDPDEDRTLDVHRAPAVGRKTFTYPLVPRSGGRFALTASLVYFDPEREAYRTLTSDPLRVAVAGTVAAGAAADGPAPPMEPTAWRRAGGGRPGLGWLACAAAVPLLALAALAATRRPRRRPAEDGPLAPARAALDDAPAFYAALDAALRSSLNVQEVSDDDRAEAARLLLAAERARFAPGPAPDRAARERDLARAEALIGRPTP